MNDPKITNKPILEDPNQFAQLLEEAERTCRPEEIQEIFRDVGTFTKDEMDLARTSLFVPGADQANWGKRAMAFMALICRMGRLGSDDLKEGYAEAFRKVQAGSDYDLYHWEKLTSTPVDIEELTQKSASEEFYRKAGFETTLWEALNEPCDPWFRDSSQITFGHALDSPSGLLQAGPSRYYYLDFLIDHDASPPGLRIKETVKSDWKMMRETERELEGFGTEDLMKIQQQLKQWAAQGPALEASGAVRLDMKGGVPPDTWEILGKQAERIDKILDEREAKIQELVPVHRRAWKEKLKKVELYLLRAQKLPQRPTSTVPVGKIPDGMASLVRAQLQQGEKAQ